LATPLALVEAELNFDKNPRLETAVGFFVARQAAGHQRRKTMIKIKMKSKIKKLSAGRPSPALNLNHNLTLDP